MPGRRGAFAHRHAIDAPYLLQAGGLSADKGTLTVLEAHRRRRLAGAPEQLVLAGRPQADVRDAIRSWPSDLARSVTLIESPPPDEWNDAVAGAALLVHPSRAESFGLVILEAWRASVPVVVADAGGSARLVRHDVDGAIVPPDNPAALARTVDALLGDARHARQLAAEGKRRVRDSLTWSAVFPGWKSLFHEAMDERVSPPRSKA